MLFARILDIFHDFMGVRSVARSEQEMHKRRHNHMRDAKLELDFVLSFCISWSPLRLYSLSAPFAGISSIATIRAPQTTRKES